MTAVEAPEVFDELVRWRYWHIPYPTLSPASARILPGDPKDQSVWGAGETFAVCRHDPSHVPPHPDCTCGLYCIGGGDIVYAVRGRQFAWQQHVREVWESMKPGTAFNRLGEPPPESPREQQKLVLAGHRFNMSPELRRELGVFSARNLFVIGRVRLRNAVEVDVSMTALQPWRGRSAVLEELFFEDCAALDEARCDPQALAAGLSDRYEVPVTIGVPQYSQEDWDARSHMPLWLQRTHEELGLRPPGEPPKPPLAELLGALNRRPK